MDYNICQVVDDLAYEMIDKLESVDERKGNSWRRKDWEEDWRRKIKYHFAQGNLVDVANYIAFGLYHGWKL